MDANCKGCREATMLARFCGACGEMVLDQCAAHHAKTCGEEKISPKKRFWTYCPDCVKPTPDNEGVVCRQCEVDRIESVHFFGGMDSPPGTTGPDGDPDAYARRDPD